MGEGPLWQDSSPRSNFAVGNCRSLDRPIY